MTNDDAQKMAESVVKEIIDDLSDRLGFGPVWRHEFNDDECAALIADWQRIVKYTLRQVDGQIAGLANRTYETNPDTVPADPVTDFFFGNREP